MIINIVLTATRTKVASSSRPLHVTSEPRIVAAKSRTITKIRTKNNKRSVKKKKGEPIRQKDKRIFVILGVKKSKQLPCESGLATNGPTALECGRTVGRCEKAQLWTILEQALFRLTFLVDTLTAKRTLTECLSRP